MPIYLHMPSTEAVKRHTETCLFCKILRYISFNFALHHIKYVVKDVTTVVRLSGSISLLALVDALGETKPFLSM